MRTSTKLAIVLALFWLLLTALSVFSKGTKHQALRAPQYDRGVNETLDTIMWLNDQMMREHKRLNWGEFNQLVCAHMNVKRTQPWERR